MIKYIQLSGFIQDVGFYKSAVNIIQKSIINKTSCVFISSKTDEFSANDERMQHVLN